MNIISHLIATAVIVIVGFIYLQVIRAFDSNIVKRTVVAFWVALSLRFLLAIILHILLFQSTNPLGSYFFDDEPIYDQGASFVAFYGLDTDLPSGYIGNTFFHYFLGTIYWLFGHEVLIARWWLSLIGAAIVPLVYIMAQTIFDNEKISTRAMWLSVGLPQFLIWSISPVRDIIITFALLLFFCAVLLFKNRPLLLLVAILSFLLLFLLRPIIALMAVVTAVAGIFLWRPNWWRVGTALLIFIGSAIIIPSLPALSLGRFGVFDGGSELVERYSVEIAGRTVDDYTGSADEVFDAIGNRTVLGTAIRTVRVLLLPNPLSYFRAPSLETFVSSIAQGIAWYLFLPLLIVGVVNTVRYFPGRGLLLWLPVFASILVPVLPSTATWEPLRARLMVFPYILILGAYGLGSGDILFLKSKSVIVFILTIIWGALVVYGLSVALPWGFFGWQIWLFLAVLVTFNLLVIKWRQR